MVNNITEDTLDRKDSSENILREEIRKIGGQPELIGKSARKKGDIGLYLELHIEQGPVLEKTANKLGIVTGIVGIHRYRVSITGKPNHAGTTPMNLRFDALTATSELVLYLESICKENYEEQIVGTVGKLEVLPNASNVIPGKAVLEFEVRSLDQGLTEKVISQIKERAIDIEKARGLEITFDQLSVSSPVSIDHDILKIIREECERTANSILLPSGAGHDANQLATIAPIGMIFVQSKDGKSHCPEEWTPYEDVALGVEALARTMINFDRLNS
jgi:N-carbamoyl-L-amino-acid hydrolase